LSPKERKRLKYVEYSGADMMSLKRFFSVYTLQLGFIIFILGIGMTLIGILGMFAYDYLVESEIDYMVNIIDSVGDWVIWCVLVGPIVLIAGLWYFYDDISKRREFKELMDTTSKAKFIRNLDRVEFLAWKLTPNHQTQLAKKKRKLNIK
jgi:hypothetical protein